MENLLGPRDANGIPVPMTVDESIASMKASLLKKIKRSAYVYRVDCGGCNGCEIEIFATLSPLFDAERFGIKVVPSPRHADILLFTGAVTRAMRSPALRAWQSAPDPKICISYGACGNSGGIFHDLYCVWGGTDKIVPVDVYIPGCPPTPAATLYGFAMALGLLEQKIHAREPGELDNQPATTPAPGYGAAAAGEDRPHAAQAGGLPLRTPDCRRLSAPAEPGRPSGGALAGGGKRSATQ